MSLDSVSAQAIQSLATSLKFEMEHMVTVRDKCDPSNAVSDRPLSDPGSPDLGPLDPSRLREMVEQQPFHPAGAPTSSGNGFGTSVANHVSLMPPPSTQGLIPQRPSPQFARPQQHQVGPRSPFAAATHKIQTSVPSHTQPQTQFHPPNAQYSNYKAPVQQPQSIQSSSNSHHHIMPPTSPSAYMNHPAAAVHANSHPAAASVNGCSYPSSWNHPTSSQQASHLPSQQHPSPNTFHAQTVSIPTQASPRPHPQQRQATKSRNNRAVAQSIHFYGHEPTLQIPDDLCLVGCVFLIMEYERIFDQKEVSDWRLVICLYGGEVAQSYNSSVTHVVCESLRHTVVQQAIKEGVRCVTAQWLNDCLLRRVLSPPWRAMHLPANFSESRPCKDKVFSMSGFNRLERAYLRQVITVLGARCTSYLCRKNDILIARCMSGTKVCKAVEWGIPVVNAQWLSDILLAGSNSVASPDQAKYQQFASVPSTSAPTTEDIFAIDPMLVSNLMSAWRKPIPVDQDCWKTASAKKHRLLADDSNAFPYKKLRLSPVPEHPLGDIKSHCPGPRPVVLFSGMYKQEVDNLSAKLGLLGGSVAQTFQECTHIVSHDVKRTLKVLKGIATGKPIVSSVWITQSLQQRVLLSYKSFIVKDEGNERFFGFNLRLSLRKARERRLFENMMFFITPSVLPSLAALRDIIESAGGSVLHQRPPSTKIAEFQTKGVFIVIISCENDLFLCDSLLARDIPVHSAEFVLTGILRQEVDFKSYRLAADEEQGSGNKTAAAPVVAVANGPVHSAVEAS